MWVISSIVFKFIPAYVEPGPARRRPHLGLRGRELEDAEFPDWDGGAVQPHADSLALQAPADKSFSTAEAEYMAVSASATEMIYLRRLCAELLTPMHRPTPIGGVARRRSSRTGP